MDKKKNKRKRIFANKMHRDIFLLVFLASLLPIEIFLWSSFLFRLNKPKVNPENNPDNNTSRITIK